MADVRVDWGVWNEMWDGIWGLPHNDVPEAFFAGGVFCISEEEVGVYGDSPGFAHQFGDFGL